MSVVVVAEVEGANQEFYEQVSSRAMGGHLPDGCQAHIAGPCEAGWRVITVWDSEDSFHKFRNESLIPALQEAGEGGRLTPSIRTDPVHRFMTA